MFQDRVDAGEQLARRLVFYRHTETLVLGLARGGVIVAVSLGKQLGIPVDVLVVRKLGSPSNSELGIGAISEDGISRVDRVLTSVTGASDEYVEAEIGRQAAQARERRQAYAGTASPPRAFRRTVIVADDGVATGVTALVAVETARARGAGRVVLAVPVASRQAVETLKPAVDELVVLASPDPFVAVGMHYQRFDQVSDQEVIAALSEANATNTNRGTSVAD